MIAYLDACYAGTDLLDDGTAFVGDMAMNGFPLRRGPGLPIFAEDLDQLRQSWRDLLALGVTSVHPAHGDGFGAEILQILYCMIHQLIHLFVKSKEMSCHTDAFILKTICI